MSKQSLNSLAASSSSPRKISSRARLGACKARRILLPGFLLSLMTVVSCDSETLFKSRFKESDVNQPVPLVHEVGTASSAGPPGAVLVVVPPPDARPPARWVRISRPTGPHTASFQAKLTRQPGNGTYVFSTALFIPENNGGVATIQFEPFNQSVGDPAGFLHLDFLPDNRIRIDDDDSTIFGQFPRNQVFMVQVTLTINSTVPKARIVLAGAGASGQADRTILPPFRPRAQQFGAVRIWMGFPHTGEFYATNIVVQRKK